jgi:hypothetical protein
MPVRQHVPRPVLRKVETPPIGCAANRGSDLKASY